MIKKIAWNTFKNTGDINTFLELKQIENIENVEKEAPIEKFEITKIEKTNEQL